MYNETRFNWMVDVIKNMNNTCRLDGKHRSGKQRTPSQLTHSCTAPAAPSAAADGIRRHCLPPPQ